MPTPRGQPHVAAGGARPGGVFSTSRETSILPRSRGRSVVRLPGSNVRRENKIFSSKACRRRAASRSHSDPPIKSTTSAATAGRGENRGARAGETTARRSVLDGVCFVCSLSTSYEQSRSFKPLAFHGRECRGSPESPQWAEERDREL